MTRADASPVGRALWGALAAAAIGAVIAVVALPGGSSERRLPALNGETIDGGSFDATSTVGSVVVVNVWASWCAPCREEQPILNAAFDSFSARGVRFVGVNTGDARADALAFATGFAVPYPSLRDTDGERRYALGVRTMPSTIVVDASGAEVGRTTGALTETWLRRTITRALDAS